MTLYIKASDCSNGVIPSMNLSEMICHANCLFCNIGSHLTFY